MKGHCLLLLLGLAALVIAQDTTGQGNSGKDEDDVPPEDPNVSGMFHCGRNRMSCLGDGSACNAEDGTCACGPDLDGHDCGKNTTIEECSTKCRNNGVCLPNAAGEDACYCEDPFYGDRCQFQRVRHECRHDEMTVYIAPFSNDPAGFGGQLYVKSDSACVLEAGDEPGEFSATLKYGECGGPSEEVNDEGDKSLKYTVVVAYDDLLVKASDQEFDFTCMQMQSGKENIFPNNLLENNDDESPLEKQEVVETLNPVTLTITLEDGSPVDGPLAIGTVLKLTYTLDGGKEFDKLKVEQVVANNGKEDPDKKELVLIDDGCISEEAGENGKGIVLALEQPDDLNVVVTMQLFKYPDSEELGLGNAVRTCEPGNGGACNATECADSDFVGVGRKKRATTEFFVEEGDKVSEVDRKLYVYNPRDLMEALHHKASPSAPTLWGCVNTVPSLLVVLVVLASLLIVTIFITVALTTCLYRHRRSGSKNMHVVS